MLYALLLMLVAVMVTVVVTSASVTSTRRISDDVARSQESLTLMSAANVLERLLKDTSFSLRIGRSGASSADVEVVSASGLGAEVMHDAVVGCAGDLMYASGDNKLDIELDPDTHVTFDYVMHTEEVDPIWGTTHPEDRYRIEGVLSVPGGRQLLKLVAYQAVSGSLDLPEGDDGVVVEDVRWNDVTVTTGEVS